MQGQPQYEVQVQGPIGFIYRPGEENRLADGNCCATEAGSSCPTACDNHIFLCFREFQHGGMTFATCTINTDIITFNNIYSASNYVLPNSQYNIML